MFPQLMLLFFVSGDESLDLSYLSLRVTPFSLRSSIQAPGCLLQVEPFWLLKSGTGKSDLRSFRWSILLTSYVEDS
jgi:hypothetical protein